MPITDAVYGKTRRRGKKPTNRKARHTATNIGDSISPASFNELLALKARLRTATEGTS